MKKFKYLVVEIESRGEVVDRNIEFSDLEIEEFCNKLYEEGVKERGLEDEVEYLEEFGGVCEVEDYYYEINLGEEIGFDVYRIG